MLVGLRYFFKDILAKQSSMLIPKSRKKLLQMRKDMKFYFTTQKYHLENIEQRGLAAFFVIEFIR